MAGIVEEDGLAVAQNRGENRIAGRDQRRIAAGAMGGTDESGVCGGRAGQHDMDIVGVEAVADPFGRGDKIVGGDAGGIEAAKG